MKIHVLTLNWNGEEKLKNLYRGLMDNLAHISMRDGKPITSVEDYPTWYVRDNGSKDGSVDFLKSINFRSDVSFETNVYEIDHNRANFAKGMNFLFEQADPADEDFILLLNNDVQFNDSKSLYNMLELQRATNADVVGARLLYTGTDALQHAGVIFSKQYNMMPYHFRPSEKSDKNAEKNRYFQAVTAAVMLIKASAFNEVGGFDEKYNWAFEDIDLALKIGQLKPNNVVYCGSTNISHEESASLKKNPVNKMFLGSNVNYFKKKWLGKYELDHDKYLKDPDYRLVNA